MPFARRTRLAESREFTVHGRAQPKGSWAIGKKRTGESFLIPSAKNERGWRDTVSLAALAAGIVLLKGPVLIEIDVHLTRPNSHFTEKSRILKKGSRQKPTTKPDGDKLIRSILDALTGIAYEDDSQVTTIRFTKRYGADDRAVIKVTEDKT